MSTPDNTPSEKKLEDAAAATDEAITTTPEATASTESTEEKPAVAKPKFKVTRSPFAPKVEGAAAKPGPINLSKPGESAAAKPSEAAKPVAPKPMAPKAPGSMAAKATPSAPKPFGVSPAAQAAPTAPKPVAPVSARKAAEMAEEEDARFSPLLMAVDAIAAIVAISFGVLIILGMKG